MYNVIQNTFDWNLSQEILTVSAILETLEIIQDNTRAKRLTRIKAFFVFSTSKGSSVTALANARPSRSTWISMDPHHFCFPSLSH